VNKNKKQSVVVIGGGTGTHTVLRGLKRYRDIIDITAVVSMADSGGSTGRLRDEFGQLPVGDVRMALTALASDIDEHEELMRELMLYRFDRGDGLSGHNFGNLFLTALTDILGSEKEAVKMAGKILRVQGKVLPITADNVQLVAEYDDGRIVVGEHEIDEPETNNYKCRIKKLYTKPTGTVTEEAKATIKDADLVIIGPGDLYSSIIANFVIFGVKEAFRENHGRIAYITNLMERPGQTIGMTLSDCYHEICIYLGRCPDTTIVNSTSLPQEVLLHYKEAEGTAPHVDDLNDTFGVVVRGDFLLGKAVKQTTGDALVRSLIRHDSNKLAAALLQLVEPIPN
jgi:uncharacterized cofD-like protein